MQFQVRFGHSNWHGGDGVEWASRTVMVSLSPREMRGACFVLVGFAINRVSRRNRWSSLLLQHCGVMVPNASRTLVRSTFEVHTSAFRSVHCSLLVKGTQVDRLVKLRIRRDFSYLPPLFPCSGRERFCMNASWPALRGARLVGLPWYLVRRAEPVSPVTRLLEELLHSRYTSRVPPALVFLGKLRRNVCQCLR